MRVRGLAAIVAAALVLVATPSSAAPERSITLTKERRAASWTSDFRVGPDIGLCDREALGCETTLIRLTRDGALSITTKQRVAPNALGGQLFLDLARSNAKGAKGKPVSTKEQRSGSTVSITARSLAAGYYLLVVSWYDLAVGEHTGTAKYVPR